MSNYKIDTITEIDIDKILDIYNSNTHFLENHMGITEVSREFITNEIKEMKNIGFNSLVIKDCRSNIIGICDFKISEEVYLSLLMIDANQQGKGLGSIVYNQLEKLFKENHANKVRIDVVYNYDHNAVDFWKKQGFIPCEKIQLEWNGYKTNAIKMLKFI